MRPTRSTNNKALRYVPVAPPSQEAEALRAVLSERLHKVQTLLELGLIDENTPGFPELLAITERLVGEGI